MTSEDRNRVQEFLQLHHTSPVSLDWLHRHLELPYRDVEAYCEALIFLGAAIRPCGTHYVQGVKVDWKAVHEGRAVRPEWSKR